MTGVAKHDLRVAAYGTVDETNAALGLARLHLGDYPATDAILGRIQNDLFDLGADLCTPEGDKRSARKNEGALRIVAEQVTRLEQEIDALNDDLAPLTSFILPGGTAGAAHLHMARTIARRAERLMTELAGRKYVNPHALQYINRLSDHLFVLGRISTMADGPIYFGPPVRTEADSTHLFEHATLSHGLKQPVDLLTLPTTFCMLHRNKTATSGKFL